MSKDVADENKVDKEVDGKDIAVDRVSDVETTEDEEADEITDYRLDIGNLEIWIGGEIFVEEDKVIIAGESNLLPGARIASNAVSDGWIAYQDIAEVEEDGSFYFEFTGRGKDTFVTLSLSTGNRNITDQYG